MVSFSSSVQEGLDEDPKRLDGCFVLKGNSSLVY